MKKYRYVHLAPPCATFSRWPVLTGTSSRTKENPWGTEPDGPRGREAIHNILVKNAKRIIQVCDEVGVYFSLENPSSSLMWRCLEDLPGHWFEWAMCSYGSAHYKPTAILTNAWWLQAMQKPCMGGHKHVWLMGKVNGVWRTSLAAAYPEQLCEFWVSLIKQYAWVEEPPTKKLRMWLPKEPVSYTHLTLPTKRIV